MSALANACSLLQRNSNEEPWREKQQNENELSMHTYGTDCLLKATNLQIYSKQDE